MLQMRELLRAAPNLPLPVREAFTRGGGDEAIAHALLDLGLECIEVKELLDRPEGCSCD